MKGTESSEVITQIVKKLVKSPLQSLTASCIIETVLREDPADQSAVLPQVRSSPARRSPFQTVYQTASEDEFPLGHV